MGGVDLNDLDQAKLGVDVDHGSMGSNNKPGVGIALPKLVDLVGWWVPELDPMFDRTVRADVGDGRHHRTGPPHPRIVEVVAVVLLEQLGPQPLGRSVDGAARHLGLAGR